MAAAGVKEPPIKGVHVKKEGILHKQSDFWKQWRERYFLLGDDGVLYYYLSKEDVGGKPRGVIPLEDTTIATAEQHVERPNAIAIFHPTRRTVFLSADTAPNMVEWLNVFQVVEGLEQRDVTADDFDLLTVVGRGKFAKVFQVRHKATGKIYAMKVVRKDAVFLKRQVKGTRTERLVLQQIKHPFCVSLRFAFQTAGKLYLVTDFINGGELFQHIQKERRFSEDRARIHAAEIVLALEYLHRMGFIHRDLKPENILLDLDGHIRITDFGLSKAGRSVDDATYTFCGTAAYMAPEILLQQGHNKGVDWWTLGILIAEMLTGLPPFYSRNKQEMFRRILREDIRTALPKYLTEEARDLLLGLLARNPLERYGCGPSDAEEIKSHPWFMPINWDDVLGKRIKMPFKPTAKSLEDTSNIDPVFTQEKVIDSPETELLEAEAMLTALRLEEQARREQEKKGAIRAARAKIRNEQASLASRAHAPQAAVVQGPGQLPTQQARADHLHTLAREMPAPGPKPMGTAPPSAASASSTAASKSQPAEPEAARPATPPGSPPAQPPAGSGQASPASLPATPTPKQDQGEATDAGTGDPRGASGTRSAPVDTPTQPEAIPIPKQTPSSVSDNGRLGYYSRLGIDTTKTIQQRLTAPSSPLPQPPKPAASVSPSSPGQAERPFQPGPVPLETRAASYKLASQPSSASEPQPQRGFDVRITDMRGPPDSEDSKTDDKPAPAAGREADHGSGPSDLGQPSDITQPFRDFSFVAKIV